MKVLITGAGRGIGAAIAEAVAGGWSGAQLVLTDRTLSNDLEAVRTRLEGHGARVQVMAADLGEPASVAPLVERASAAFDGLDAVVSNAGITGPGPLNELALESWDRLMNVNVRAAWLLAKSAHAALKHSRGCFLAVASTAGMSPYPTMGAYSPSKAALLMLCRQLAQEWASDGIRVNTISPGMVRTPLSEVVYRDPALKAEREALIPIGEVASAADIADVAVFLLSKQARYITGHNAVVDGGFLDSLNSHIPGHSVAPD